LINIILTYVATGSKTRTTSVLKWKT